MDSNSSLFPQLRLSKSGIWYRKGQKLSDGSIAQIIWLFEQGHTAADITRITCFNRKTVDKYKKLHMENKDLFFLKVKQKMTGNHTHPDRLLFLYHLVKSCPGLTLEGMKLRYLLYFEESISKSMVFYIISKLLGFVLKKTVPIEYARLNRDIIELHDEFVFEFLIILVFFQIFHCF